MVRPADTDKPIIPQSPGISRVSRGSRATLTTRAAESLCNARGYPRPMLRREPWWCLDGTWDFAIDYDDAWTEPAQVPWDRKINVPFAPETSASGVRENSFYRSVWYRRSVDTPALDPAQRLLLHFGAVDESCRVWINGLLVAEHDGGYVPFSIDITDQLHRNLEPLAKSNGQHCFTIVVQAVDDPHDLAKPRGKQDWELKPHSIWYPRTTGIWQTVWMERVQSSWIGHLRWTPNVERWEMGVEIKLAGCRCEGLVIHALLRVGSIVLADDTYTVIAGEVHRRIALSDPGVDDYRNQLLWKPSAPTLIDVELQLCDKTGRTLDHVHSYTALRSIGIQGDRFVLNGRPYMLRMVLDQGYWPETGLTARDDAAIKHDVELAKSMGFNGVRRHQHVSDPRYLYWADRLGLLVWGEMPSAYRFTRTAVERLIKQWAEVIRRDASHPCIVAWVPFNESWGVPDLPDSPAQRHCVQALYHLTRTLDPTRPVIGNDGWEAVATDIIGIHDYEDDPRILKRRYGGDDALERLFKRERPGGRQLLVHASAHTGQPLVLSEFGGIALSRDHKRTWGYSRARDGAVLAQRYESLLKSVRSLAQLAGFCYTQFADTYQEANGLLYADRRPKFPLARMRRATAGPASRRERATELAWRQRMMSRQRSAYLLPEQDHQPQTSR